jgi:hypothetical protein
VGGETDTPGVRRAALFRVDQRIGGLNPQLPDNSNTAYLHELLRIYLHQRHPHSAAESSDAGLEFRDYHPETTDDIGAAAAASSLYKSIPVANVASTVVYENRSLFSIGTYAK